MSGWYDITLQQVSQSRPLFTQCWDFGCVGNPYNHQKGVAFDTISNDLTLTLYCVMLEHNIANVGKMIGKYMLLPGDYVQSWLLSGHSAALQGHSRGRAKYTSWKNPTGCGTFSRCKHKTIYQRVKWIKLIWSAPKTSSNQNIYTFTFVQNTHACVHTKQLYEYTGNNKAKNKTKQEACQPMELCCEI